MAAPGCVELYQDVFVLCVDDFIKVLRNHHLEEACGSACSCRCQLEAACVGGYTSVSQTFLAVICALHLGTGCSTPPSHADPHAGSHPQAQGCCTSKNQARPTDMLELGQDPKPGEEDASTDRPQAEHRPGPGILQSAISPCTPAGTGSHFTWYHMHPN